MNLTTMRVSSNTNNVQPKRDSLGKIPGNMGKIRFSIQGQSFRYPYSVSVQE